MAEFPAMPLLTDAYLGDTHHLTLEENGAYLKLLMIAWRTPDCSLPDDDKRLATMLGVTTKRWREKLRPIISPFWQINGGKWTQKKQQEVRKKVEKSVQQKRDAVAAREKAKHQKNNDTDTSVDPSGDVSADVSTKTKDSESESNTSSESYSENPEPHPNLCSVDASAPPERGEAKARRKYDFDEWWSEWRIDGTKRGKSDAKRQYRAVISSGAADHETLCAGVRRLMAFCERNRIPVSKIVYPERWLSGGRWDDELVDDEKRGNDDGTGSVGARAAGGEGNRRGVAASHDATIAELRRRRAAGG